MPQTRNMPTRGQRNNNPLNIRHSKAFMWMGEQLPDADGFARFNTMLMGVRAAFALIRTYNFRHNLKTVRQIIERWAPPEENHTELYISYITHNTHLTEDTEIRYDSADCRTLIQAMGVYESTYIISEELLQHAQNIVRFG